MRIMHSLASVLVPLPAIELSSTKHIFGKNIFEREEEGEILKRPLCGIVALLVLCVSNAFGLFCAVAVENPTVSGLVRDKLGTPISDVLIVAQDALTEIEVASTTTNVTGEYALCVPVGTYNFLVTPPPESGFANTTISDVEVTADVVMEIVLVPADTITFSGVVVDRDNTPVPNTEIEVSSAAINKFDYTDENGSFSMRLPPDFYNIRLYRSWPHIPNVPNTFYLGSTALNLTEDTSMNFTLENRYLSGKVVDPYGSPVANVTIYTEGYTTFSNLQGSFYSAIKSDSQGNFNASVFTTPSATLKATPPPRYAPVSFTVNATEDKTIIIALVYQPNFPPIAGFEWTPLVPVVGDVVTFNASSSTPNGGAIVSFEWDFGDGLYGSGELVTHQYSTCGNFTVGLNVTDSEGIWDVEQKQITVEAPPTYTLAVESSPTGVEFMVDGVPRKTPWIASYIENASVSLTMPEIHAVGEVRHFWDHWDDGPGRSRTVAMTSNITLTAYYAGPYHELTVTSSPITGIPFTINGEPEATPYTHWLLAGSYTLHMPQTYEGYLWSHWLEDGDTDRIKTITLPGTTYTAVYSPPPVGGTAVSMKSGYKLSWIAATLLVSVLVMVLASSRKSLRKHAYMARMHACWVEGS